MAEQQASDARKQNFAENSMACLKILLVEDQAEARQMMRGLLEQLNVGQVFEAGDGREALQFISSKPGFINLMICDWNMPSVSGLDVLKGLREIDPAMPFLMVTGRSDIDSVVEAKSSGVTAYIRKPFTPTQLEAKLRIILQRMDAGF